MVLTPPADGDRQSPDPRRYPIPVYLNQKYCFDLLAMMEDGLAQLETVRTTQNEQGEESSRFSGDVGLKDAFAFSGVKFGGERSSSAQTGASTESTMEKVHTPNSLFAKVRKRLQDEEMVIWAEINNAVPGEFVEFSAALRKNPLTDALEGFVSLGELASLFDEAPQQNQVGIKSRPANLTG